MTFDEIRQSREPGKKLHFRLPDIKGTLIFNEIGGLKIITDDGVEIPTPLCFSDFDRDDWVLSPIAEG